MDKLKPLIKVTLGFITTLILILIVLLIIFKLTVFNKSYLLKTLDENNYYNELTKEIQKDMEYNLLSSGLDKTILNDLVIKNEVKSDVMNLVDSIYSGNTFELNTKNITEKLNNNIDKYLKKNNIMIVDKNSLNSYTEKITDVYKKEVSLYGYFNNYTNKFAKINNFILVVIPILTLIFLLNLVLINKKLKGKYAGVTILSSGLVLLFIKEYIMKKIDYQNLLVISEAFSKTLKKLLMDIDNYILITSIALIILGIILNIINAYRKKKSKKHKE